MSRAAAAAEEQTAVAQSLDRSVVHISDLAGQSATGSEHTAAASSELARLGESLRSLVSRFRT